MLYDTLACVAVMSNPEIIPYIYPNCNPNPKLALTQNLTHIFKCHMSNCGMLKCDLLLCPLFKFRCNYSTKNPHKRLDLADTLESRYFMENRDE